MTEVPKPRELAPPKVERTPQKLPDQQAKPAAPEVEGKKLAEVQPKGEEKKETKAWAFWKGWGKEKTKGSEGKSKKKERKKAKTAKKKKGAEPKNIPVRRVELAFGLGFDLPESYEFAADHTGGDLSGEGPIYLARNPHASLTVTMLPIPQDEGAISRKWMMEDPDGARRFFRYLGEEERKLAERLGEKVIAGPFVKVAKINGGPWAAIHMEVDSLYQDRRSKSLLYTVVGTDMIGVQLYYALEHEAALEEAQRIMSSLEIR